MMTTKAFEKAYAQLNPEQKKAVDTVEGPVMVLAGPGTGKTYILILRIANILRITQAKPEDILALTFTDSAVRTMRKRLSLLIGEDIARKVTITTFHGFAELVRNEYPNTFSEETNQRLMGAVEETLLLREAIDTADIDLLRPSKAPYTYLSNLRSLYNTLSREGTTFDEYVLWGKKKTEEICADESLQYKRGANMGSLTKVGRDKLARYDKVKEVVRVFEKYQQIKESRLLMDFSDMLSSVVNRIASDDALRSDLQEHYQYILADEHQDANAQQHRLLELLSYDEHPNLFVVGDEKQAIYRFQGAEVGAFKTFTKIFPRATVVELTTSFRSYQHILDTAHRVVDDIGTHAELTTKRGSNGESVSLIIATDPLDERARVVKSIAQFIKDGVLPHEIAVIARTNDTANLFASALTAYSLPVLRAGSLSLTERPVMRVLISLMSYVADPTNIGRLREALLAPWWGNPTADLLKLLRTTSDKDLVAKIEKVYPDTANILSQCIKKSLVQTPIECFSYIFTESSARDYFLSHTEHLDDIALVRALMMHLESVVTLTEATTFSEAFQALSRASEHGLSPVNVSVTEREGFITVITAHKAKGMEFRYVFIPDCTESAWEKGGQASKVPSPFENKQTLDDACRLFYVALTRAKDHAYLSYARASAEGRERNITNLIPSGLTETKVESEVLPLLHTTVSAPQKIRELIDYYLNTESISPSAINDYLESPAMFFARRVLRIHEPPVPALIYGNAMHAALATALSGMTEDDAYAMLEQGFTRSLLHRDAMFEKLRSEARVALKAVLPELPKLGTPEHIEKKFSMTRVIDGTPVTIAGKIDAVFRKDGHMIVSDFKTGSSVSAKNTSYSRQLALYAIMLDANGEHIDDGVLLGISDSGIKRVPVIIGDTEKEIAIKEVDDVVRELRSGNWRRGATSDYDAIISILN